MNEVDEFLSSVIRRHVDADKALHSGDATLRKAMWSTKDPVTLFGALFSNSGWDDVESTFDSLATRFSNCSKQEFEVVAAGVSGDLAYTVAYEHTTTAWEGKPPVSYTLRVTHVYRREDGEWKVVHRHGDKLAEGQRALPAAASGS